MKVILLNKDYAYINAITVRRALKLMAKEKVTVEKYSQRIVKTVSLDLVVPLVLRLVYRVQQIYRRTVAWSWSRRNVMIRDRCTCVYCGRGGNRTPSEAGMACKRRGEMQKPSRPPASTTGIWKRVALSATFSLQNGSKPAGPT